MGKHAKILILIVLASALGVVTLGRYDLRPWDEPFYALRARAAAEDNAWLDQNDYCPNRMANACYPPLFVWLAGASVCGGAALWLVYRLLRRAAVLKALRGIRSDTRATTVVEFPFALLVLIVLTLLTWQLGYLLAGRLVLDYSAYAAVRSASVVLQEEGAPGVGTAPGGQQERRNWIRGLDLEPGASPGRPFACSARGGPRVEPEPRCQGWLRSGFRAPESQ